jgi:tetratricopeptide (TPR) repeat protein
LPTWKHPRGRQDGKRNMNELRLDSRNAKPYSTTLLAFVAVIALGLAGCDKLKARDLLHQGTQAYAAGQTDAAIEDFKKAMALDPDLLTAQLYLATAYQGQYVPGAPSDDNMKMANQALTEYKSVLDKDPNNISALDGVGSLLFAMANPPFSADKLQESKTYWEKHIAAKPEDPEPYYWMGLIDWTLAYHANAMLRSEYNHANVKKQVHDDQPLPSDLRDKFSAEEAPTVDDGIANIQKAIQRRADYDDAMVYLNLIYRQKADMTANQADRDALLKQADDLVEQVKQIKQKKGSAQPSS